MSISVMALLRKQRIHLGKEQGLRMNMELLGQTLIMMAI
jgi:hypothetical protein